MDKDGAPCGRSPGQPPTGACRSEQNPSDGGSARATRYATWAQALLWPLLVISLAGAALRRLYVLARRVGQFEASGR